MTHADHGVTDPSRVGDRYLLVQRVDTRASLETWEAFDERLDRTVVVRFLTPDARGDAEALRKLRDTGRTTASLVYRRWA